MENQENQVPTDNNLNLVRSLSEEKPPIFTPKLIVVLIAAILLGLGSGYILSKTSGKSGVLNNITGSSVPKGTVVGSNDMKTFRDTTEGVLKQGGIDGEGQYHLVRPGGDSQNVYLTSSIVDLSKFLNKKVKVWGETQKAQHAGWLMDVGRVEVL